MSEGNTTFSAGDGLSETGDVAQPLSPLPAQDGSSAPGVMKPIQPGKTQAGDDLQDRAQSPVDREGPDVSELHGPILREHSEPREGHEGMSLWLVGCFMALIFWAGWYVAMHVGGWRGDVLDASPESGPGGGGLPIYNVNPMQLGRQLYGNCMPCHQVDGQGLRGLYPPLAGSEWVQGDAEVLSQIVLRGLEGPIDIKGDRYNNIMPPWSQRFDDREMAALLTYIRSSFGNQSQAVSADVIAAARKQSAGRVRSWRAGDLEAMKQDSARRAAEEASKSATTGPASTQPTTSQPAPMQTTLTQPTTSQQAPMQTTPIQITQLQTSASRASAAQAPMSPESASPAHSSSQASVQSITQTAISPMTDRVVPALSQQENLQTNIPPLPKIDDSSAPAATQEDHP